MTEALREALDPRCSAVVRACAGSGKTWLLAARIVRILLDDESALPGHILAITFTRAAAGEIAARTLDRVRELAEAGGGDSALNARLAQIGVTAATPRLRDRARKLHRLCLLSQPRMTVNTFHGWFRQLAQVLPWSAGQGREAAVVGQAAEQRDRAWSATVRSAAHGGQLAPVLEHLVARMSPERTRLMLDAMLDKRLQWEMRYRAEHDSDETAKLCAAEGDQAVPGGADDGALFVGRERILSAADSIAAALGSVSAATKYAANYCASLACAKSARNAPEFVGHLRAAMCTKDGSPRKQLRSRLASCGVAAFFDELAEQLMQAGRIAAARAAAQFNRAAAMVAAHYARQYAAEKRRDGTADFVDLELPVWRAMALGGTGAQDFAERLDRTYRHILIDEFQDTSPPQWQIMREWLLSAHGSGCAPSVFIVGDPKQSIYGFRGADSRLMAEAASFLAAHYRSKTLQSNTTRRCAQAVVDVVNTVFAELPEEDFAGFARHATTRADLPGAVLVLPGVHVATGAAKQKRAKGVLRNPLRQAPPSTERDELQLAEGAQIAAVLREALASWAIFDRVSGATRRCVPEDVMVLYPTRGSSEFAARMLRREGIPCALPDSGGRMLDLECADMIALMRAVSDPRNSLAVAHALRCPLFDASEDDLWAVHRAGGGQLGKRGNWDAGLRLAQGSEKLSRAKKLLARWRNRYLKEHLPAHEMLASMYCDASVYERYVSSVPVEMGERCVRNLERIMNCAIEMDGGKVVQLGELARRLAGPGEERSGDIRKASRPEGCVAMMTVHAAKGLESPVVVLSNSEAAGRPESAQALVGWQPGEAAPQHCSFCRSKNEASPVQKACWAAGEAARRRERLNLLYVGMTRASQALVLSATHGTRKGFDWHSRVSAAMQKMGAVHDSRARLLYGKSLAGGEHLPPAAANAPHAADTEPVLKRSGKPYIEAAAALRRGEQLHKLMALLLSGVDDSSTHRAVLGLSPAGQVGLRAVADRMLNCAEFAALRKKALSIRTEYPVSNGREVRRIDCLLDTGAEKWIIDFKSGFAPDTTAHRADLAAYRKMLAGAGELGPVRVALLGGNGVWQEIVEV